MLDWNDEHYLGWVREQACCQCGTDQGVQAHHIIGVPSRHSTPISGRMGRKNPHCTAMPLCGTCHQQLHLNPMLYAALQWQWMAESLATYIEESKP